MGKIRGSSKTSQDCYEQIQSPTQNRSLTDSETKGTNSTLKSSKGEVKIRRTERVRRVKPNFYDSLDFEKRKKVRPQRSSPNTQMKNGGKSNKESETSLQNKRMHLKTKKKRKKPELQKEEDLEEIILSKETLAKFSLILDEINRKICASSWKV